MAISYSFVGIRHAHGLLADIAQCGVEPPQALIDLVETFDELAHAPAVSDPIGGLIKAVSAGQLRGKDLEKQIADAATAVQLQEFRTGLQARVEPALVAEFIKTLDEGGAADAIIDSLRPAFDEAASKLAECAELVNPGVDPETFLAAATADQIKAWQAIDEHITTLTKISSAIGHFGPHSTSFPMSEIPVNISTGSAFINNLGVLCVDAQLGLERGCSLFLSWGNHRNSPWFKGASALKLNTIAETREKIRAWAESAWDAMGINQGRGRLDPEHGFIPEPIANPFAKKDAVTQ